MLNGNGDKYKVGILGGTFDPVHNAHLAIADEARLQLELDEVVLVPAGQPWMKSGEVIASAEHRVAMLRLAIDVKFGFSLSTIEIDRTGPSYTVDTLLKLYNNYVELAELYFIMGWDNLPDLPRWKEPSRIIELCHLVALPRPGYALPDLDALDKKIPGLLKRVIIMERPEMDISATEIRERVAKGLDISKLVPKAVEEYIREKGLYQQKP
jgi:nicotinate-nucleotide adenylyltransferase